MTIEELMEHLKAFDPQCEMKVLSRKTKARFGTLRAVTGIFGCAEKETNRWMAVLEIDEPDDEE